MTVMTPTTPNPRRKTRLVFGLLFPAFAQAALMHRPISHHPIDVHATPRVHIKFLNDYPITRGEADSWKALLKEHGDEERDATSHSVSTYEGQRETVDVSDLGDVFIGMEVRDSWDHEGQAFKWRLGPLPNTESGNTSYIYPRLSQLKLPSRKGAETGIEDWLCMLPSLKSLEPKTIVNDSANARRALEPADPVESLHSLDHLNGKCLYHRAGWFTYAYCHGSHVRQFREVIQHQPLAPGLIPGEDEQHEAYDLGVSPSTIEDRLTYWSEGTRGLQNDPELELQLAGYELALAEHTVEPEIELVQNPHGRYLVQKWSGGTICDMTGRPRRIEIQFHCRMGGVDEISSIKEIATCQYLMTVHSPHLCSLPGFHIPTLDDEPARPVKCRQIVPDEQYQEITVKQKTDTEEEVKSRYRGDRFPEGYPLQPHGPAWHFHTRKGGRVKHKSIDNDDALQTVVVVKPSKKRKSTKAAEADRMDADSRKAWLAEERAKKIATRERLEQVQEEIKQVRQEIWDSRWDVKLVKKAGWLLGVDEQEYREWWEALMDEQDEEDVKESEKRRMKV